MRSLIEKRVCMSRLDSIVCSALLFPELVRTQKRPFLVIIFTEVRFPLMGLGDESLTSRYKSFSRIAVLQRGIFR